MTPAVAIVGMGCQYPDAPTPEALWKNVLAQRRAFRRIPPERLNLDDYGSTAQHDPDRTYATWAAVLEGYTFDRVHFRVSGDTFRSVDLAHWLALDVASQALRDAGFPDGVGLPRETTGVLLGNTLTGEFSRANVMRLRWPYVRRILSAALAEEGWEADRRRRFLRALEARYKAPFPPVGTETLAGGLSNTIAGRICNYFDLKGGGYTVDGACAASLLAVIHACQAVAAGELDAALAGGVDLSLDPFELVGFARVGALAAQMMRVYDAHSEGFWPAEGCGFVVLMRHEDALRQGCRVYAVIRGWGISSDGSGGITRPEAEGQLLAVRRAWRHAKLGIDTAALFEGHGTGTRVGDTTELHVLSTARREADPNAPPAAIGSIKANIGHTKAAAGVAGLLKATLALHHQILPPTTGCDTPHAALTGDGPPLRVLEAGERWPPDQPLRAGVSAMGFGGINTHLVLESPATERHGALTPRERVLLASAQDAEVFLLAAAHAADLRRQVDHLRAIAPRLSLSELTDLAAVLAWSLEAHPIRAALVAATPEDLARHLDALAALLDAGMTKSAEPDVYFGRAITPPRIGFLFPGQGVPAALDGGAWRRRFASVQAFYEEVPWSTDEDSVATNVAQPAIVTASMAGLRVLERIGLVAHVAVGHSLGELTSLHWAGALDEQTLQRLALARGRAMADLGAPTGAMASLAAGPDDLLALVEGYSVVVAGLNGPRQTVIAGEADAVDAVVARARAAGMNAQRLRVSHAFHSPLVAAAAGPLAEYLSQHPLQPLQRPVASTIAGRLLTPDDDLADLLVRQVTNPVRFTDAVAVVGENVDLWVEVGPGAVLSGLIRPLTAAPVVATDAGGQTLRGLLQAVAAAFALGAPVRPAVLFEERFTRPFRLDWQPQFLVNPCELAPAADPAVHVEEPLARGQAPAPATDSVAPPEPTHPTDGGAESVFALLRRLAARRVELPLETVRAEDRLLSDLHLNSITVSELVNDAARRLHLPPPPTPTTFADATLAELAAVLEERKRVEGTALVPEEHGVPAGVAAWICPFVSVLVEHPRPPAAQAVLGGSWQVFTPEGYPLRVALQKAFAAAEASSGVVVGVPPEPDASHVDLLLAAAQAVLEAGAPRLFVLVQHGGGAAAFARTLHLEAPQVTACVVDVPPDHPEAATWVAAEARAATDYVEAYYDDAGVRRAPCLRLLPLDDDPAPVPLGPDDVLLITGGGKGITATCALALARATGVRLVLLGRARPDADAELAATLKHLDAERITYRYIPTDVTDAGTVRAAVEVAEAAFGPVTAVLHGAARNVPCRLRTLDAATVHSTLAPKLHGLHHVLAAVDPEHLRLLVTFGSIIARMGLPGEADYALANEWMTRATARWQETHPHCRCLAVEWSIWSEVGMGARLGSIDALARRGITPIPPDTGTALLLRLLAQPTPPAVVITGRFGAPPTLRVEKPELPLRRFLEQPRVYYPGVELVVDARLSVDTDPYLEDHVFQGERLLPAVLGLEAMAQAAMALTGRVAPPVFEDVVLSHPVVVPPKASTTIRVAACATHGAVDVVLRSEQTSFLVDHFRARCRFDVPASESVPQSIQQADALLPDLDPEDDLYGTILFHTGRFRRVHGYRHLRATACIADVGVPLPMPWFGRYLPQDLVLGDPGARDATIHAIQACIPHATLLPIGVERLSIVTVRLDGASLVHAREHRRDGDMFVYDVDVTDTEGRLLERWEGLRLRRVGTPAVQRSWPVDLLAPYLERRLHELALAPDVRVALMRDAQAARRTQSDRAIQRALGIPLPVRRRSSGKPETAGGQAVSATHSEALTFAVAGTGPLGCDVELICPRSDGVWRDLLGPDRFDLACLLAREAHLGTDEAATRVWTVLECLKKAGAPPTTPLVLDRSTDDGWIVLAAGALRAATWTARVQHEAAPFVIAVLGPSGHAATNRFHPPGPQSVAVEAVIEG